MGQPDPGFRWLSKACQDRCFELMAIKVDPKFDPLREDPRFVSLVKTMGLD